MNTNTADVVVIGGGPSGIQTASLAAKNGLKVVLIEQNSDIGKDVVCSGIISSEAFSRFDLPQDAIVGSIKEAELSSPSGINVSYTHPETAAYVVDRHLFDSMLAERGTKLGLDIWLNTRVLGLDILANSVELTLKTNDTIYKVYSEAAVIATGVSFKLQQMLGLGRPSKILRGHQIEIDSQNLDHLRVFFGSKTSKGFFGWAIPLNDGRTRIGVMSDGNPMGGLDHLLSEVLPKNQNICACNIKKRGIAFGTINKSYTDRVLVVGEAAGQIKTTTGGGIYYGLIGGEIAAEVLVKAFQKNDLSSKTLAEYESKWKKELGWEITFGKMFHKFFSTLDDESIDLLFEAARTDGLLQYVADKGKFDWHMGAVKRIIKSPNLRKVLFKGLITQTMAAA